MAAAASVFVRWLYRLLAFIFLALAVLGVVLPGLPSVPFVLLAAWAAAKGSPALLAWMESHPHFGPPLRAWRQGGHVSRRAKWAATLAMSSSLALMLATLGLRWHVGVAGGVMAAVLAWLWRRPEPQP